MSKRIALSKRCNYHSLKNCFIYFDAKSKDLFEELVSANHIYHINHFFNLKHLKRMSSKL